MKRFASILFALALILSASIISASASVVYINGEYILPFWCDPMCIPIRLIPENNTEELKSTEQDSIKVYSEIDGAMYIIDENAPEAIPTFDESDTTVFVKVEQMPEFPNGNQALLAYLAEKIKYPIVTGDLRGGKEMCEFIVNKDGSICNVHISQSSVDSLLTKELLQAIQQMPNWIPGKHKGHVVRVKYVVPVNFIHE